MLIRKLSLVVMALLLVLGLGMPSGQARSLSDLIKRPAQLFLPSQVIPGESATVTLKGRPGQTYLLLMSSRSDGRTLENGMALRVGPAGVKQTGVIPETGVAEITFTVPQKATGHEFQYMEAVVWTQEDQSDAELAQMVHSSGMTDVTNEVLVGKPADHGNTLLVPGDPSVSGIFRSLDQMNAVKNDPRKKALVDTGAINRDRQIDRNLNNSAQSQPMQF